LRFDHYISKQLQISKRNARTRIASGEFFVDGSVCSNLQLNISRFEEVKNKEQVFQPALERLYIKLNKPISILSATRDEEHTTLIDLIDHHNRDTFHLARRLDRSSSGLVLLSNDSSWTESLTQPGCNIDKVYLVKTDRPIPAIAADRFSEGFDFESGGIKLYPPS